MNSSDAKHYGCKYVRHCGLIASGRSQVNRDFSCVRNVNCCFVRCAATISWLEKLPQALSFALCSSTILSYFIVLHLYCAFSIWIHVCLKVHYCTLTSLPPADRKHRDVGTFGSRYDGTNFADPKGMESRVNFSRKGHRHTDIQPSRRTGFESMNFRLGGRDLTVPLYQPLHYHEDQIMIDSVGACCENWSSQENDIKNLSLILRVWWISGHVNTNFCI